MSQKQKGRECPSPSDPVVTWGHPASPPRLGFQWGSGWSMGWFLARGFTAGWAGGLRLLKPREGRALACVTQQAEGRGLLTPGSRQGHVIYCQIGLSPQ